VFKAEKQPTTGYMLRDVDTGKFMGFEYPTVYWKLEDAKFAMQRQRTRSMSNIEWEIVTFPVPSEGQHTA
jgi:hypothetical protein